jgi:hypothetical protein
MEAVKVEAMRGELDKEFRGKITRTLFLWGTREKKEVKKLHSVFIMNNYKVIVTRVGCLF